MKLRANAKITKVLFHHRLIARREEVGRLNERRESLSCKITFRQISEISVFKRKFTAYRICLKYDCVRYIRGGVRKR